MPSLDWRLLASPYTLAMGVFHNYKPAPHLRYIDSAVMDAFSGRGPRTLLVEGPPRHGKSEHISFATPLWALMHSPNTRIVHNSYNEDLSKIFGGKVRDSYKLIGREYNGFGLSSDINGRGEWETTAGGGMVCVGRNGTLTGRGANLLIVDDPFKNAQEALSKTIRDSVRQWWGSTVSTRIEADGIAIVTHTRWYSDDLIGNIVDASKEEGGREIRRISLPAIAKKDDELGRKEGEALWPYMWPLKRLKEQEADIPAYWWRALYQQDPTNPEGTEFPWEWFNDIFEDESTWPGSFDETAIAMDPSEGSEKGDFQGIVWTGLKNDKIYVDCDIEKRPLDGCCERLANMWRELGAHGVLLEANSFQRVIEEPLQRVVSDMGLPPLPIWAMSSVTKKTLRIQRLAPYLRKGILRFRKPRTRFSGCERLLAQLKDFPHADHDDGPDALEMSIRMLNHLRRGGGASDRQEVLNPR